MGEKNQHFIINISPKHTYLLSSDVGPPGTQAIPLWWLVGKLKKDLRLRYVLDYTCLTYLKCSTNENDVVNSHEPLTQQASNNNRAVDGTQSQTSSTVQNSPCVSLVSESADSPRRANNMKSDFELWARVNTSCEGFVSSSTRFLRKRKTWWKGGWLPTKQKSWARLADDSVENTPILEHTRRSDDKGSGMPVAKKMRLSAADNDTPILQLGALFIGKSSIQKEQGDVQNQAHKMTTPGTLFQRLQEKTKNSSTEDSSNMSDTDEEEHIPSQKPVPMFQSIDLASDSSNMDTTDESLLLAQEMFENASRVLDKELLDIASLENKSLSSRDKRRLLDAEEDEQYMVDLLRKELEGAALPNGTQLVHQPESNINKNTEAHPRVSKLSFAFQENTQRNPSQVSSNRPPVFEIAHRQLRRIDSEDLSAAPSDLSSLSGSIHLPIEFNLERGFTGKKKHLVAMVARIVKSIEQTERRKTETSAKCLILMMDPSKKIFEIVQVPYIQETTTIEEILARLPLVATDRRLARVNFKGFSCNGILFSDSMVPIQRVLETQSTMKPIFAVPEGYNPDQIEALGHGLLSSPHVAQLLQDKLAENARLEPGNTQQKLDTNTKENASTPRRYLGEMLGAVIDS